MKRLKSNTCSEADKSQADVRGLVVNVLRVGGKSDSDWSMGYMD